MWPIADFKTNLYSFGIELVSVCGCYTSKKMFRLFGISIVALTCVVLMVESLAVSFINILFYLFE